MGKAWTFRQLGGSKKVLTLDGPAAPHGRPRRAPIVTDAIKLRRERVYYPSKAGPPTTHIFGIAYEDWQLKGRFMDKNLGGPGATKSLVSDWKIFVADAQPVLITWGDVLTTRGYVDKFAAAMESEFEAAYTIDLVIDDQPGVVAAQPVIASLRDPLAICQDLQDELDGPYGDITTPDRLDDLSLGLQSDFLDELADLVAAVNIPSALVLHVSQEIDDLASGTLDQLERLRAGAGQFRTAVLRVQSTVATTDDRLAALSLDGDSSVQWDATRTRLEVSTLRLIAFLEELDRNAELAERGKVLSSYTARLGDSWERIATQFYGGPEAAGQIRDANGVRYGQLPVPGRSYMIPSASP